MHYPYNKAKKLWNRKIAFYWNAELKSNSRRELEKRDLRSRFFGTHIHTRTHVHTYTNTLTHVTDAKGNEIRDVVKFATRQNKAARGKQKELGAQTHFLRVHFDLYSRCRVISLPKA